MAEKANNKEWQPSQSANEMRHDAVTATGSAADNCSFFNLILFRGVAQLVARDVWDVDAAGSNPVTPTKIADLTAFCGQIGANLIRHRRLCTVVP